MRISSKFAAVAMLMTAGAACAGDVTTPLTEQSSSYQIRQDVERNRAQPFSINQAKAEGESCVRAMTVATGGSLLDRSWPAYPCAAWYHANKQQGVFTAAPIPSDTAYAEWLALGKQLRQQFPSALPATASQAARLDTEAAETAAAQNQYRDAVGAAWYALYPFRAQSPDAQAKLDRLRQGTPASLPQIASVADAQLSRVFDHGVVTRAQALGLPAAPQQITIVADLGARRSQLLLAAHLPLIRAGQLKITVVPVPLSPDTVAVNAWFAEAQKPFAALEALLATKWQAKSEQVRVRSTPAAEEAVLAQRAAVKQATGFEGLPFAVAKTAAGVLTQVGVAPVTESVARTWAGRIDLSNTPLAFGFWAALGVKLRSDAIGAVEYEWLRREGAYDSDHARAGTYRRDWVNHCVPDGECFAGPVIKSKGFGLF